MTIFETIRWLVREVRRLGKKIDGIRGPGINNTRDTLAFNFPKGGGKRTPEAEGGTPTFLEISADATKGGTYEANTCTEDFSAFNPTAAGALDLGNYITGATFDAYFINAQEDGIDAHDLSTGDIVYGWEVGTYDGKPVYLGQFFHLNC